MVHHKAVVGLSGGVDSAVSTYKLLQQKYEVVAVSMVTNDLLSQKNDILNAEKICKIFNIKHKIIDKRKDFDDIVINNFVNEYKNGRTPNPCAICNRLIKFKMLYDEMINENADTIATGHYANVILLDNGRYAIKKSKNLKKDQSYLLYNLTQEQLSHIYFPIADSNKDEIRNIAKDFYVDVSTKKDSFDLCFIKDIDYIEFIKQRELGVDYKEKISSGILKEEDFFKKGRFIDKDNNTLGFYNGLINWTIGQRKGLNMAFGERKYVVKIDNVNNEVLLGNEDELFADTFFVDDINFQSISNFDDNVEYEYIAKLRYRHNGTKCRIKYENNMLHCNLYEKARAITPGQVAVFYNDDDTIICGGVIV